MRYLSSIVLTLLAVAAKRASYPDKPVTMIAPFPPGGSVDLVARAVAQQMSETSKQPSSSLTGRAQAAISALKQWRARRRMDTPF